MLLPMGTFELDFEAMAATARKEISWRKMLLGDQKAFQEAGEKHWQLWLDHNAVQLLTTEESRAVEAELEKRGLSDIVLQPRWVLTDKNDGKRSDSNPLPLLPGARLIIPGCKDPAFWAGELRSDAPTGGRNSQNLLCSLVASEGWCLASADVRAAFLKGDSCVSRELYMRAPSRATGPKLPIPEGCLCKILKGVFGLSDAPRGWYLRLDRRMVAHGWARCQLDQACWRLHSDGVLHGMVVGHVDDLLIGASDDALGFIKAIGDELGFGSFEVNEFV